MKKRSGFTLVELLVVISLLAVILPMAGGTVFFLLRRAIAIRRRTPRCNDDHSAFARVPNRRTLGPERRVAGSSPADQGVLLDLDGSRVIEYRTEPNDFVSRIVRRGETVERRERFRVGPVRPKFAIAEGGREIAVTISPRARGFVPADKSTTTTAGIRIAAVDWAKRENRCGSHKPEVHEPGSPARTFRAPRSRRAGSVAIKGSEQVMNATSFTSASIRRRFSPVSARTPRPRRRGVAALIALVCLSLATIVGTLLLQAGLSEQRYLDRLALQAQGEWLVEAGFSRARAQLANSGRYSGETWAIPGSSFGRGAKRDREDQRASSATSTSRRHVDVIAHFAASNEPAMTDSCEVEAR